MHYTPHTQRVFGCLEQNQQEQRSTILVAATQNHVIQEHLALFEQADISPERLSIDLFDLYGLYRITPKYQNVKNSCLIDFGFNTTQLAYIVHGKLSNIRTLPKGVSQLASEIGSSLSLSPAQA